MYKFIITIFFLNIGTFLTIFSLKFERPFYYLLCLKAARLVADSIVHVMSYRIYHKNSDTSAPYHICSKIWTSTIFYQMLCLKVAGWVANSIDPDEMPHSAASHLGLHCLLRRVCPNTYSKYGIVVDTVCLCLAVTILSCMLSVNKMWKCRLP